MHFDKPALEWMHLMIFFISIAYFVRKDKIHSLTCSAHSGGACVSDSGYGTFDMLKYLKYQLHIKTKDWTA